MSQAMPPATPPKASLIQMIGRFIVWLAVRIWGVLWNDKVPLLINIILIGATAWITYGVAPHINGTFERQKIQSSYILENLRSINGYISELYVEVGEISYSVAAGQPKPEGNVRKARETINRLNWKLVETAAVLERDEDLEKLEEFQVRLEQVRQSLDRVQDVPSAQKLTRDVREMSIVGVRVIESIGDRASLDPDVDPN
jgi:hypothetical protein